MKRTVLDTFLYGTGVLKTGYDSEYGYGGPDESREGTETEQEFQEDYERYINPFQDRNEYNTNIIPGMPWALRVHPKNFGVAPGYDSIDASPWVYHKFYRHLDEIKNDPKYKNTDKLQATHRKRENIDKENKQQTALQKDCEYVELFEISDMRDGKMKVIATGCDKYLRHEDDPLLMNGHKYASMKWNEDTDGFWGIPDTKIIEPQQLELNQARTQYSDHRRMSVLKLLVEKGALSEDDLDKLKSGEVGSIIEVAGDVQQAIQDIKPHLSNELPQFSNEVRRDIRETVGFSRNQMGDFDTSSRRTATEAEIVQQASQIRIDERRDMAADLLVEVTEKLNSYIFQYWQRPRVSQIVGQGGAQEWIEFTGPQIRGEYDLRVDADTARAMSSDRRKQEAQELLSLMSNFPPELVNMQEILRYVASQYEGIDERRILNIQTQQDQVQPTATPLDQAVHERTMEQGATPPARGQQPTGQEANIGQLMQALGGEQ